MQICCVHSLGRHNPFTKGQAYVGDGTALSARLCSELTKYLVALI